MGFREIYNWPYFQWKSKRYICSCQIDNQDPFDLSGHLYVTSAAYTLGNLGRHWKKLGGVAKETGVTHHNKGIWWLDIDGHCVKLTIYYIDAQETPPVAIDPTSIKHESGCSEQSARLLEIIRRKLKLQVAILASAGRAFDWLTDEPDLYDDTCGEPVLM